MRILIVSHNCFGKTLNMGKTLLSLFSELKCDEIMQLYLYPSIPTEAICENYFRITDNDAIKSIFSRGKCGEKIKLQPNINDGLFESQAVEKQYKVVHESGSFLRRMRDVVWSISAWKSNELKEWLLNGKPDVVFYALGDAVFSQNIAIWISEFLNVPLVTYVCDEFYFSGKRSGIFKRTLNAGMLNNIKKVIKHSKHIVTICDELGELYNEKFDIPYTTIMTGSSFQAGTLAVAESTNQISYIGNLALGRAESLLQIQEALNAINKEKSSDYKLVYYGSESEKLKNKVIYGGYLDVNGVKRVMSESMLLIHTESFDKDNIDRIKYSVSTKIADSLASGKCLLAYAPADTAAMQYLKCNDLGYCITSNSELCDKLFILLENKELQLKYSENGINAAELYHNTEKNSKKLYDLLSNLI